MAKVSIALSWPIRWKRIANGERVIEQTEPDEIEVDVRDGEMVGASWIEALVCLFAEAERETFKPRRGSAALRTKVQIPTTSKGGGQKTTAKRTGAVE